MSIIGNQIENLLRDGGLLYARRLEDSGVPVRLHSTRGTMHGYDIVLDSPITRQSVAERAAFLKSLFAVQSGKLSDEE